MHLSKIGPKRGATNIDSTRNPSSQEVTPEFAAIVQAFGDHSKALKTGTALVNGPSNAVGFVTKTPTWFAMQANAIIVTSITRIEYDIGKLLVSTGNNLSVLSRQGIGEAADQIGNNIIQMETGVDPRVDGAIQAIGNGLSVGSGIIDNHSIFNSTGNHLIDSATRWRMWISNEANPCNY